MKLIERLIKKYYKMKGYDTLFRKYKVEYSKYSQSLFVPNATYSPWENDIDFLDIYNKIKNYTLVDKYRCYELWQLCLEKGKLVGDYIEIGVWKGGTGMIIAKAANKFFDNISQVFLCDTFQGVVKEGIEDNRYVGGEHSNTSKQIVLNLIKDLQLKNVNILEGIFPDETANKVKNNRFKICHIDVDVYRSAKEITEWIWDKMIIGGIIIYDDFGFSTTQGVTKFVESQKQRSDRIVIYNLNGHAIIIKLQ